MCLHKILLENDCKSSNDAQRRLNLTMKEIVQKEVLKWLDAGVIYPISNSPWVSLVQVVPNKGGMAVVQNENNELIPIRTVDWHCNVIVFKICATLQGMPNCASICLISNIVY